MYRIPKHAGYLDYDRLNYIPDKHKMEHEYCFLLHDYMVNLLVGAERAGAATVRFNLKDEAEAARFEALSSVDVLSALETLGYSEVASKSIANQVAFALYADMLHFLHDGLIALEKRKFAVALSLLRKPFKENLFFAAWLCGDQQDFHRALAKAPDLFMDSSKLQKNKRLDVFRKAKREINHYNMFDADLLYAILYDKDLENGLSNLFDKATHLVTSSKPLLRTERLNLNLIFKDPLDDDIYEFIYTRISYLTIFALQVQCHLFGRMQPIEELFSQYSSLVAIGCHNCLFSDGKYFTKFISKTFKEFIACPYCKSTLKFKRHSTARLLMTEQIVCERCGEDSHFPLHWLLSKADWNISGASEAQSKLASKRNS